MQRFMAFSDHTNQQEVQDFQKQTGSTPRELVLRQIKNYDYHVTEEDIENMDLSFVMEEKEKAVS